MTTPPLDPYSAASYAANPGSDGGQIPGSTLGASMMTINTSQLNVSSEVAGGLFGYAGPPDTGTLFFSVTPAGGIDPYGNTYPTGLSVTQGLITGTNLAGVGIDAASTLTGSTINLGNLNTPVIQGGTATSSRIVLNSSGGQVLSYSASTASSTFTANGLWTCPAGVTQARVQSWGAGAGGDGGTTTFGGQGGNGGEYAEEPTLPVTPGAVYTVTVGAGGQGGSTGFAGADGGDTVFQDTNFVNLVYAHGGQAAKGAPGTGSANTIHFDGGLGASASGNSGGNGGGSSAGTAAAGNPGTQSSGASGGAGGSAPAGGGAGGAGGASGANGVNGSAPGGSGGGAGLGTSSNAVTETFYPSNTWSYYSNSGLRNTNGNMFHGAYSGEAPDYQYSYIQWAKGDKGNNLNSVLNLTVNWVTLRVTNLHTWYNNGMTFGLHTSTTLGGAQGVYGVLLSSFFISEGNTFTYGLNSTTWSPLAAAGVTYLVLAPNSSNLTNLNWYGYFYGGGGAQSSMPQIQVNYQSSGVGSFNAGNGANGKIIISWSTSTQLVGAVSPAAGDDGLGNTFAPGVTTTQHTMLAQSSAPSTPTAAVVVYSDNLSKTRVLTPSTYNGVVGSANADVASFTVTAASATTISHTYAIPANDANVGTVYRLTVFGNGTEGSTLEALILTFSAFGQTVPLKFGGSMWTAVSAPFSWHIVAYMIVTATGVSGTANLSIRGDISRTNVNLLPTAGAGANETVAGTDFTGGVTVNTTTSQNILLQAQWQATTGAPTITSSGSILERLG